MLWNYLSSNFGQGLFQFFSFWHANFSCVASSVAYTQRVLTIIFLDGQAINCKSESQIHTHMNFWCVVFVIEKSNRTRKNGKAKKEKPN